MAHDELTPEQERDDASQTVSQDASVGESQPESVSADADMTPRERAMEIFRTREFDGESLRMGQVLRRVRESLGLEIADVSRATLMRKDYLMWIERMEVGELPGGGYLTAILNTYAKYLKLPEKDVIRIYSQECGAVEEVHNDAPVPKIGEIAPERSRWPLAAAAAVVLIALGAGALGVSQLVRPNVELSPEPGVVAVNGGRDSLFAKTTRADRPVPKNLPLELVAVKQGWLEVRGADGTIFRSRVMAAGESYFPRLEAGWTVSARDGSAFEWRVGDVTIGPLGPEGTPVYSVSIDDQIDRAVDAAAPAMAANGGNKATR
ncbi:MAG: helix-turn-helix domain-containing protein [Hyphomonas sp.]|nr:helix-turn-helix domain-containing protein [Hyphomonas sp.]